MANVELTSQQLFEAIEELRLHRELGERILNNPFKEGELTVWLAKAAALVERVVPESDYYVVNAYREASGRLFASTYNFDARQSNRDEAIRAKLPAIEAALESGNKRLTRMASAGQPALVAAPPPSQMPDLRFTAIKNDTLRAIAERDYRELRYAANYRLAKSQATLAGSVAEAALLDALLRKNVPPAELERLPMGGLYSRAVAEGLLVGRSANAVAAATDARNFVHAGVEFREGVLTPADADNALTTMFVVLQELRIS